MKFTKILCHENLELYGIILLYNYYTAISRKLLQQTWTQMFVGCAESHLGVRVMSIFVF